MSATLTIRPAPHIGAGVTLFLLKCPHGLTRGALKVAPEGLQVSEADAARMLLLRHHEEQQCRCLRQLWRRYFGCRWPELALVQQAGGVG